MENRRILTWHSWSATRKAQVLGALIGAVVTSCIYALASFTNRVEDPIGYYIAFLWGLMKMPTVILYWCFNSEWVGGSGSWVIIIIVNSILLGVAGTFFGYIVTRIKKR